MAMPENDTTMNKKTARVKSIISYQKLDRRKKH